ncbi:enoyl-CoA hydratase-related protein [Nitratireductor sp. XY-223]|uniref:enoyl-CoA hydratase/isomerase family protein n=1 Tax=Nitratireductor sp. XY-223 TaxID=2561926 RepID=UPI0010AB1340|nr:enoyl-CoA hydratase-related protein [Nitratireductor sp. XY-223]
MTFEDISLDIDGAVATITVRRPDKLNALLNRTADELCAVLSQLEDNPEIRVALLTGEGRAFGAGYDLSTVGEAGSRELDRVIENHFNPLIRALRSSRLPIIAAVNGPCAGVSVGIALACDIVMAADTAYFYEPFAGIALVPDGGNTFFLPKIAGRMRATAAMLLGERISADEALSWGLVWEVHDAGSLMKAARNAAERIAGLSPNAVAATKRLVSAASEKDLHAQLDLERDVQGDLGRSPEMHEAISTFLGGR